MGRHLRFKLPGIPQLITQRGHNRLPCFMDGADYSEFQEILAISATSSRCHLHALLLLPHAYWLLATPEIGGGVSTMIQRTGRCYVRYCNSKYRREGTLWASRYHACLVDPAPASMQQCLAFLHRTPNREGVTAPGTTWPWLILDVTHAEIPTAISISTYEQIADILHRGLVWGSEEFRRNISAEVGIQTEPGRRGRPPSRANSIKVGTETVGTGGP